MMFKVISLFLISAGASSAWMVGRQPASAFTSADYPTAFDGSIVDERYGEYDTNYLGDVTFHGIAANKREKYVAAPTTTTTNTTTSGHGWYGGYGDYTNRWQDDESMNAYSQYGTATSVRPDIRGSDGASGYFDVGQYNAGTYSASRRNPSYPRYYDGPNYDGNA